MSTFFTNQGCDCCHKIETGLVKFQNGKIEHRICYKCLANITLDLVEFATHNLRNEIEEEGYEIGRDNEGIYSLKPYKEEPIHKTTTGRAKLC
jgi:hypothetical protein